MLSFVALLSMLAAQPSQPFEPSSQLVPQGEEGPARLPPELQPPAAPTDLERRELRLLEAREAAGDGLRLGPGPKDPWRAVALSCEGTLVGLLFPPLLTIGPAAGQLYAGHFAQAITTSSLRALILIGIGAAALQFALAAAPGRASVGGLANASAILDLSLLGGGAGLGVLSALDIATAYGEASAENRRWEDRAAGE